MGEMSTPTAFREIFRQRPGQASNAATKVQGRRRLLDTDANSGRIGEYCFHFPVAGGKKVFSGPLVVALFWIGAYRPQRIGLRQPFPVSLQFLE